MKRRIAIIASCVLMLGAITSVALADLVQWANTPWPGSKWFQPPELVQPWGYDIASNVDPYEGMAIPWQVVADDWRCTSTQPVAGFRWWGSYFNNPTGQPYTIANLLGFYVMIFADVPAGAAPSHPGQFLKQEYFTIAELGYGEVGHQLPIATDSTGNMVYEYFGIFDNYFLQQGTTSEPVVYWVSIVADLNPNPVDIDQDVWGWHTSVLGPEYEHNLDDAVVISNFNFTNHSYSVWDPIEYQGTSLDMAFEVIPEPTALMLIAPGVLGLFALIRRRK